MDIGPFELADELAGIGRQRFDVLPLPLGEERVEGQRALAGAAGPREHDQLVARQIERNALQIVDARAANTNCIGRGGARGARRLGHAADERWRRDDPVSFAAGASLLNANWAGA